MTNTPIPTLHLPKRGPRSEPPPEWESQRHQNEVAFWAAQIADFERSLAKIRHNRGDARAARLMEDVLATIRAAEGTLSAWQAGKRLAERWGDRREKPPFRLAVGERRAEFLKEGP